MLVTDMLVETKECPFCGNGQKTPCFAVYTDGYHCFTCGKSKKTSHSVIQPHQKALNEGLPSLPKVNKNPTTFTVEGQKFLLQYFITQKMMQNYSIWETERKSFIFPVFDADNIVFYVERYYNEKKIFNRGKKIEMLVCNSRTADTLVIVEDFLSAIRVHDAGFSVLCLFGTKIKFDNLVQKTQDFDNIVIWLDGDDAGQSSARVLNSMLQTANKKRRLLERPKCVYKLCTQLDPKKYNKKQIGDYIHEIISVSSSIVS